MLNSVTETYETVQKCQEQSYNYSTDDINYRFGERGLLMPTETKHFSLYHVYSLRCVSFHNYFIRISNSVTMTLLDHRSMS